MKIRIDELLVLKHIAPNRSKARQMIEDGLISYKGKKIDKPGQQIMDNAQVKVTSSLQYVGRGAKKLEAALQNFKINLKNKIVADVGASTGGFTDCALQNGAKKVYAIDVGHDQLAPKLKADPRVVNIEKTNIRYPLILPEKTDYAVVDLSYISLRLVLKNIFNLLKEEGKIIALFKPQFEAGPGVVGKDGVIKNLEKLTEILQNFQDWCEQQKFNIEKIIESPITGKEGNTEFLALITSRK